MNPNLGSLLAVAGGVLMGSFSLPMRKTTKWAWENTWMIWAVSALVVMPWLIAWHTIPELMAVLGRAGMGTLAMVFLFGFGWGLGSAAFGRSIAMIGMSLAFALSLGLTLALGALVPMIRRPEVFGTVGGMIVTAGIGLMLAGVVLSAIAGQRKEKQMLAASGSPGGAADPAGGPVAGAFFKGLILCLLSGIFNPMLNFAFEFGDGIKESAVAAGAAKMAAPDAVWAIALAGGFVSNAVYCTILLIRNRTWSRYALPGVASHWPLAAIMGVIWVVSLFIYGRGADMMGNLGSSAGWAIVMGCCILSSNVWGIVTGEWKHGRGRPLRTMIAGLVVILVAIAVIGYGNALSPQPA